MGNPANCKYTKEHEWVRVEGGVAVVGVTEFAQSELGDIVFAELPATGKAFKQAQSICVLESTKAASDVYSPVSGTVKEVNMALRDDPSLINRDPFNAGWLVKLESINESELDSLMTAEQYDSYLG